MPTVVNPDSGSGFYLAEMTAAINALPNLYTRLGDMGVFRAEPITQRSVLIDQIDGVLSVLPSVPLDAPSSIAAREARTARVFNVPWIPHDDRIMAQDLQGVRALGMADMPETMASLVARKLLSARRKHAQTREYMEINALKGIVKDGAGATLYSYFTEFGVAQQTVDFVLGTDTTDIPGKCRSVLDAVEQELKGESMVGVHVLCSPTYFNKLTNHPKVVDAYKYYQSGPQPLRADVRQAFPHCGVTFEYYYGSVSLSTGSSEALIADGDAIAFPIGTIDTFVTYESPANLIETVNTMGMPLYARLLMDAEGRGAKVATEASILPVNKRPRTCVRLYSSN